MWFSYKFQLMLHWMLNRASPGPCALQHKVPSRCREQQSAPRQLLWSSTRHCSWTYGTSARGTGKNSAAHLGWSLTSSKTPKPGWKQPKISKCAVYKTKHFTNNMPADFNLHWAAGWIYSSDFYNFLLKKLFDLFHWGFIHSILLSWFFLLCSLRTW